MGNFDISVLSNLNNGFILNLNVQYDFKVPNASLMNALRLDFSEKKDKIIKFI